MLAVPERSEVESSEVEHGERQQEKGVWDEFCITDYDRVLYGQVPFNELAFWDDESGDGGKIGAVELSAFKVRLVRQKEEEAVVGGERAGMGRVVVQG